MRSVKRMLRSYFEIHGDFKGIEQIKPYDVIIKTLQLDKKEISKLDEEAKTKLFFETMGDFKFEDLHSKAVKFVPDIPNLEYVKLLSSYIKNDPYATIKVEDTREHMTSLLFKISNMKSLGDVKDFLEGKNLKSVIKESLPVWTKSDTTTPIINMNKFYYDGSLSVSERNAVVVNALYDVCLNSTKIDPKDRFKGISLVKKDIVALGEVHPTDYMNLVNLAFDNGYTVAELLDVIGCEHIDCITQYQEFGFTITAQTKTAVKVFDITSDNFIILNNEDFELLVNNETLPTLYWNGDIPHIRRGKSIPLNVMFDNHKTNTDFRR